MADTQAYDLELARVRDSFESAVASYDEAAVLEAEVGRRLLGRLDWMRCVPTRLLDLGCGTGLQTIELARRYPEAEVIAMDLAHAMVRATGTRTAGHPTRLVCGDAARLPLADGSVDMVFSNLTLQWCLDVDAVFAELHRVLRPNGLLLFTTFGPDTLHELRSSWAMVDDHNHVNAFFDLHDLGDALGRARFTDPVMDCEQLTVTYAEVLDLMRDLKAIGAHNVTAGRPRGLTGRGALRAVADAYDAYRDVDGRLPATYEVVYGQAWRTDDDPAACMVAPPIPGLLR